MSVNKNAVREQLAKIQQAKARDYAEPLLKSIVETLGEEKAKAAIQEFLAADTRHPGGRPTLDDGLEQCVRALVSLAKDTDAEKLPNPGKIVAQFLAMAELCCAAADATTKAEREKVLRQEWDWLWKETGLPDDINSVDLIPEPDNPDGAFSSYWAYRPRANGETKPRSLVRRVERILDKMRKADELPQGC